MENYVSQNGSKKSISKKSHIQNIRYQLLLFHARSVNNVATVYWTGITAGRNWD